MLIWRDGEKLCFGSKTDRGSDLLEGLFAGIRADGLGSGIFQVKEQSARTWWYIFLRQPSGEQQTKKLYGIWDARLCEWCGMGGQPHGLFTERFEVALGILRRLRSERARMGLTGGQRAVYQLGKTGLPIGDGNGATGS